MLKTIKSLLERSAYLISLSITCLVIYLSLSSPSELNIEITVSDKTLHSIAYLVLTFSWLFAIKKSHKELKGKLQIGFAVFLFGIIIEVLQSSLTIYRHGDYLDIIANTIGIVLAIVIFNTLFRFYKAI
ncbi:MAG: VanZ family protein [Flavobacteriaceae bacterium]|nr:VanZ family protein [Flavobacteriaceae bacterium]